MSSETKPSTLRQKGGAPEIPGLAIDIFSTLRESVLVLDSAFRVVAGNDAFYRTFAVSPEQTEGRLIYELGNRHWDIPMLRRLLEEILSNDQQFDSYEVSGDFEGIGHRTMLLNARRISPGDSGQRYILLAIEDITEGRLAEARLRVSEANMAAAQSIAHFGSWEIDLSQNKSFQESMVHWSDEMYRIAGRDPALTKVTGQLLIDQANADDKQPLLQALMAAINQGTPYSLSYRLVQPNGGERIVFESAQLFRDAKDESQRRLVGTTLDITEKKRFEIQLLRAQRMESIGTLAGGIAHDLNNVLTPIIMAIATLQAMVKEKDAQSILTTLQESAQRGAALVKHVLSFARGAEGKRSMLNLRHIATEIRNIVRETFPKNIEFKLSVAADVWPVEGDATQLHQVLMNLCVNSRDAMPQGGKLNVTIENVELDEIYAGMNPESKPGLYAVVKVEDNGSGIPAEIQDRIFDPFFTTKEIGKGTGLGLATTMAIVKSHGGFINLYSEVGKGTRFKVYFPARPGASAASDETSLFQLPRGNGELVLVIDDEEAVRAVAKKTLERYGYRVLLAMHGAEALALYAQHQEQISVVITDMAMPIMDGAATIVALKAMNGNVRIVGSSGLASNKEIVKAAAAGVRDFIPKPYTAEAMLTALDRILHEQSL